MIRRSSVFDFREGQPLAAKVQVKIREHPGQRAAATHRLGQLHNLFVSVMDGVAQRFINNCFQHHRRLMFIKQDELRVDVGFDGKLVQQARAKSVNGGNYRTLE